ncbi:MAG: gliding motility-associated C-terminal domain-containing protein [Bacteroidetes bacterium]|nr:MAG: gliding motility-associated C-terminal domain-containing protein [Bacteroidota bacterium]
MKWKVGLWIAEFDFRIADGTAADGIAFCYLDVPPTGFVWGGGSSTSTTTNFTIANASRLCTNNTVSSITLTGNPAVSSTIHTNYLASQFYGKSNKPLAFLDTARLWYNGGNQRQYVVKMIKKFANTRSSEKMHSKRFSQLPVAALDNLAPLCANAGLVNLNAYSGENTGTQDVGRYLGNGVSSHHFIDNTARVGLQNLLYTHTSTSGCIDTANAIAIILAVPQVSAVPDKEVLVSGQAVLDGQSVLPPQTVGWLPPQFLSNVAVLRPINKPTRDITYVLEIPLADGCKNSDAIRTTGFPNLLVTNVFSANGDGINYKWIIRSLGSYPGCTVGVFDWYGQKVFHSKGYSVYWSGLNRGLPLPAGVYHYFINPKNGAAAFTASLTLVR